jgi:hypothetical protein
MQDVGQAAPQNTDRPSRSSINPPLSLAAGIDAVSRMIWCGAPLEEMAFSGLELGISARGASDIGGQGSVLNFVYLGWPMRVSDTVTH